VHGYDLFDQEFRAPLSWTLSAGVRGQIEARSGGNVKPSLCCALELPAIFSSMIFLSEIVLNLEPFKHLEPQFFSDPEKAGLKLIAPNLREFRAIIRTVEAKSENAKASRQVEGAEIYGYNSIRNRHATRIRISLDDLDQLTNASLAQLARDTATDTMSGMCALGHKRT
jgi:hypothetical protein